jgi:hypothetical protein
VPRGPGGVSAVGKAGEGTDWEVGGELEGAHCVVWRGGGGGRVCGYLVSSMCS